MTEEKSEAERREEARKTQLGILKNEKVKSLYVAAAQNLDDFEGALDFGREGKQTTYSQNYIGTLQAQTEDPDSDVARLQAKTALRAEGLEAQSQGGATYNQRTLLFESAIPFYLGGIDDVKVSDMIELMPGVERYEDLNKKELDMYMGDLKKSNKELYSAISVAYIRRTQKQGVGEALIASVNAEDKGLERILNEKTDKAKEESAKARETA